MEVQLYVYDLTHGMARSMSRQFLGIQIDAVYHTALVFNNVEYFFGQGVQTCYPGTTHHGRPMEIISMGTSHLPLDTILEYLESLKEVYTAESYDLFAHNCNNFTHDFSMFLVGTGIPEHITSLPKRVLDTPFGQMLRPQIDASMRSVTQAPVPQQNVPTQQSNGQRSHSVSQSYEATSLGSTKPVLYEKIPPLDKLMTKLGTTNAPSCEPLKAFLQQRQTGNLREAPLPDLNGIGKAILSVPTESRFAAVDLLRASMADSRVSGFFAEDKTIPSIIQQTLHLGDSCPHNLRLVTIHLASNIFASHLYTRELYQAADSNLTTLLVQLISTSLLDVAHSTTRVAAASLAFNLAVSNYRVRTQEEQEGLAESEQVELAASMLEALQEEKSSDEAVKGLLLAFGYLIFGAPKNEELADLCSALDARKVVGGVKVHERVAKEVLRLL